MPEVSVIIPVYKVEDYLAECLDSVIRQTFRDIEVICVDDASTDGSLNILNEYARRDSRIRVIRNEKNGGLACARNRGMEGASGAYVLFVDSDDVIDPGLVESCLAAIGGCDMACFDYRQAADGIEHARQHAYKMKDGLYEGKSFFAEAIRNGSIIFSAWSKMYSRKFLMENNISFYEGILYEDILFSFRCFVNAGSVCSIKRKLYEYRIREKSIMTGGVTAKSIESYTVCLCELTKAYLHMEADAELSHAIEGYIRNAGRDFISALRKWNGRELEPEILKDKPEYLKLYRIFSDLFVRPGKLQDFSPRQLETMRSHKHIILYGAGDIARGAIEALDRHDIPLHGIAVSDGQAHKNRKSLMGNPVRELHEYSSIKDECLVLIGTVPRYYSEIRKQLEKGGFTHIMEAVEDYEAGASWAGEFLILKSIE